MCLAHSVPGDGRSSGRSLEPERIEQPRLASLCSAPVSARRGTGHAEAAQRFFMTSNIPPVDVSRLLLFLRGSVRLSGSDRRS